MCRSEVRSERKSHAGKETTSVGALLRTSFFKIAMISNTVRRPPGRPRRRRRKSTDPRAAEPTRSMASTLTDRPRGSLSSTKASSTPFPGSVRAPQRLWFVNAVTLWDKGDGASAEHCCRFIEPGRALLGEGVRVWRRGSRRSPAEPAAAPRPGSAAGHDLLGLESRFHRSGR